MASYLPPTPLIQDDFNSASYLDIQAGGLTLDKAQSLFLRFPNAQGTENFDDVNVSGDLTTTNADTYGTVYGYQTSKPTSGASIHNTAYGYQSAKTLSLTSGTGGNSVFGAIAMPGLEDGAENNTAIGHNSLWSLINGSRNTAVGVSIQTTTITTGTDNTCIGFNAKPSGDYNFTTLLGSYASTGSSDGISIGANAGRGLTAGVRSMAIGKDAIGASTVSVGANDNLCIGHSSGKVLTGGVITLGNTAIGNSSFGALAVNTQGSQNVCVGFEAGARITNASFNTIVGSIAGDNLTTGTENTLFGYEAGGSITTGSRNIAIGEGAIRTTIAGMTGNDNVCVGFQSGHRLDTGTVLRNVALGNYTLGGLRSADTVSGTDNTCIGHNAGGNINLTSSFQTAIGSTALDTTASGANENTCMGYNSGGSITSGDFNTLIGVNVGSSMTSAFNNTAVGYDALRNMSASSSTAIGYQSGFLATGANNLFCGFQSGTSVIIGTRNVYLGKGANTLTSSLSQQVVIGSNATSNTSNSITLGRENTDSVRLNKITPIYTAPLPFIAGDIGFEYTGAVSPNFGTGGSWIAINLAIGIYIIEIYASLTLTTANTQQAIRITLPGAGGRQTDYLPGCVPGNPTVWYSYSGIVVKSSAGNLIVSLVSAMSVVGGVFNPTSFYTIRRIA